MVEERNDVKPVVYLYPELEERFGFAADLAEYPQWVRRLGKRPPERDWHLGSTTTAARSGITGGVDLNLRRPAS